LGAAKGKEKDGDLLSCPKLPDSVIRTGGESKDREGNGLSAIGQCGELKPEKRAREADRGNPSACFAREAKITSSWGRRRVVAKRTIDD